MLFRVAAETEDTERRKRKERRRGLLRDINF